MQFHHVFVHHPEALGGCRAQHGGIVPSEFGVGFGQLLQPPIVGKVAVPHRRVGAVYDFQPPTAGPGSAGGFPFGIVQGFQIAQGRLGRRDFEWKCSSAHHPVVQSGFPKGFEVLTAFFVFPVVMHNVVRRFSGIARRNRRWSGAFQSATAP